MIAWNTATKVAKGVISTFPKENSRALDDMEVSLASFAPHALELVQEASGLRLEASGLAVRCTSRAEWVDANVTSMSSLMDPLFEKLTSTLPGPFSSIGAQAGAVQFGLLFAWMSRRVLGQYDAALFANSNKDASSITPIYMVGSNILGLEEKFGFPKSQFERWVLLHELTHKLQFEAVDWMHDFYTGLVAKLVGGMNLGPRDMFDAITRVIEELKDGRNPMREAGLAGLFVTDEQRKILSQLGGLMSVLEGHGDLVMSRAATPQVIPEAERFEETLHSRRASPNVITKLISQLYGLDAKVRQYEQGRKFLEAIEVAAGNQGLMKLFEASENMPDLEEIASPDLWLSRVMTPA